jgi:F-type H+-transporting ATPase subunit delta
MTEGSVARRYAKALLEIAHEAHAVDRFGNDLEKFWTVARLENNLLLGALSNPVFTQPERRLVLERVLPGLNLDSTVANFLRLLLDKRRMDGIEAIVREYRAFADTEANRVRAIVTTATAIDAVARVQVQRALEVATGKSVVLEAKVDGALIGGMVAQVGSRVYDASIRSRLERLTLSLSDTRA